MKLTRPLVVLDLETTGTWIEKDRIIEIGMIRCEPDGLRRTYERLIHPGMPIPPKISQVTGLTDNDVKEAPYFSAVAGEVMSFLDQADLAGFNLERFDLPVLSRELTDAGQTLDLKNRYIYDAQKIYHLHERRDLTAAYLFYCGNNFTDAHSALADSEATLAVLAAQIEKYGQGSREIEVLRNFEYEKNDDYFGTERKFRWWNGELHMMFGKYSRKVLRNIAKTDRGYLEWILKQDFSDEVKELIEKALQGQFPVSDGDKGSEKGTA